MLYPCLRNGAGGIIYNNMAKPNWIKGALGKPGALHRQLHIPEGKKIPESILESAAKSKDKKLARRARLVITLNNMRNKNGV